MLIFMLDEPIVVFIAAIAFAACIYSWFRFKEYQAVGWACVSAAIGIAYTWIALVDPPDLERRVVVRVLWAATLLVIIYWRAHFIVRRHLGRKR